VEVMTAFLIVALAAMGFFQVFAFGAVHLERLGYRRQALGLLDGEMEYWRARFHGVESGNPVPPAEAEVRRREIEADPAAGIAFGVEPEVSPMERHRDLAFQTVRVRVTIRRSDVADTLTLENRLYVR
jgi:hypothetical protein